MTDTKASDRTESLRAAIQEAHDLNLEHYGECPRCVGCDRRGVRAMTATHTHRDACDRVRELQARFEGQVSEPVSSDDWARMLEAAVRRAAKDAAKVRGAAERAVKVAETILAGIETGEGVAA